MSFTSRTFRDALGCFATGVAVVTGLGAEGRPIGVTVNSFTSVSLDPPLVLFNLDRVGSSAGEFGVGRMFAVNLLAEHQEAISRQFATTALERWNGVRFETWDTGCPILPDSLANLEGEVIANHDGGDHMIVVGRVSRLRCSPEGRPLLYFRGSYVGIDN